MNMIIPRDSYLSKLIRHKHNHLIKIVTGMRRCGKSFLLFKLFRQHLIDSGVSPSRIIEINLDDRRNKRLRDPDVCLEFVLDAVKNEREQCYVLIDEVQYMPDFEDVLNTFLHVDNLDAYVTGSNSKFLSSDIITEFRGRGDEIRVRPLTVAEFQSARPDLAWDVLLGEYFQFGGLPYLAGLTDETEKRNYLRRLFSEVYLRDILERNKIRNSDALESLLNIIASAIGSLTNPLKLERAFDSAGKKLSSTTISQYLGCMEDAFLIEKAFRFDIKGKRYISTPLKYYFTDVGLRNARLGFRQLEETHIMENVIYNELSARGYDVDVGVVETIEQNSNGNNVRKQTEIDFIANRGAERCYIQSAWRLPDPDKARQEVRPLLKTGDSFRKFVIVGDNIRPRADEKGIITMGLKTFLLAEDPLAEVRY